MQNDLVSVNDEPCFRAAPLVRATFALEGAHDVPVSSVLTKMFVEQHLADDPAYKVEGSWRIPVRYKPVFTVFLLDHENQKAAVGRYYAVMQASRRKAEETRRANLMKPPEPTPVPPSITMVVTSPPARSTARRRPVAPVWVLTYHRFSDQTTHFRSYDVELSYKRALAALNNNRRTVVLHRGVVRPKAA